MLWGYPIIPDILLWSCLILLAVCIVLLVLILKRAIANAGIDRVIREELRTGREESTGQQES